MVHELLPTLNALQREHGYLPLAAMQRYAAASGLSMARISAVATFFSRFRLQPQGRHRINVCVGAACHVKGAERVYAAFRRALGIKGTDDTDADRLFTVDKVACLGCCMLAVAVQIDDHIYGWVEPADVEQVIRDFLAEQARKPRAVAAAVTAADAAEIRVCRCSSCRASGAGAVWAALAEDISAHGLQVRLKDVSCTGQSYSAVQLTVAAAGMTFHYNRVQPADVPAILHGHFSPDGALAKWRWQAHGAIDAIYRGDRCPCQESKPDAFAEKQCRVVTEGSAENSPADLAEYRRHGGFEAFIQSLAQSPDEVIDRLVQSGLRGRGGGGFPTGMKWRLAHDAPGDCKVLICNADEGDPGAFMDRMLLESFPYRVIEGMLIAAALLPAKMAIMYIREEYAQAIRILEKAIACCEAEGLLRLLGEDFQLRLFTGAGAFVCGEETALLASIEGFPGIPRARPPFPTHAGLNGLPTLINNVETFACVPWIMRHGPAAFAALGTSHSAGSKTFALAGKIQRGGLIEVPMGISLRELVFAIGGGVADGHDFKAVLIGGPSGGCLPEALLDLPVDYEALTQAGAIMGSGGLVVLDERDCIVDIAAYFLRFVRDESCGKCTFCREGLNQLCDMVEELTRKSDSPHPEAFLDEIQALAEDIQRGSLCGLGRTAPNVVLTALRYFRAEFVAHLAGQCPAGKCVELTQFEIGDDCIGCTKCAQHCAADAIAFAPLEKHVIDQERCVKCGVCRDICPQHAIAVRAATVNAAAVATPAAVAPAAIAAASSSSSLPPSSPASVSHAVIVLDGRELPFVTGGTILSHAQHAGVSLPTLCHHGECQPQARCMVCAVYDLQLSRFVPACETRAVAGHAYESDCERVARFRRRALELLLNRHDFRCGSCAKRQSCVLLDLVKRYGAKKRHRPQLTNERVELASGLVIEPDKCVLCGRCVGLAAQLGLPMGFQQRGVRTHVAAALGVAWDDAVCDTAAAQALADICPVGALHMAKAAGKDGVE